jgi:hypothetical protein
MLDRYFDSDKEYYLDSNSKSWVNILKEFDWNDETWVLVDNGDFVETVRKSSLVPREKTNIYEREQRSIQRLKQVEDQVLTLHRAIVRKALMEMDSRIRMNAFFGRDMATLAVMSQAMQKIIKDYDLFVLDKLAEGKDESQKR